MPCACTKFVLVGVVWCGSESEVRKSVEVKLTEVQLEVVQSWRWLSIPWKSSILPASARFSLNTRIPSLCHLLKELQEQKHKYINLHAAAYTGIPLVCWGLYIPALWGQTLSAIMSVCPTRIENRRLGSIIQVHCSRVIDAYLRSTGMPARSVVVL